MNICPIRDELFLFVDGEVDPDRAEAIRRHLGRCDGCFSIYRELSSRAGLVEEFMAPQADDPKSLKKAWKKLKKRIKRE